MSHPQSPAEPRRILALDVGKYRIGMAVMDPLGLAPQGLPTLERTTLRKDLQHIASVMAERSVELLVVGDPLHLSGRPSAMAGFVRGFGDRLQAKTRVPVQYWDERLTSHAAEERLRELGQPFQRGDGAVDRMAAILLLEDYLHTHQGAAECD